MLRLVWFATRGAALAELTEMAADPDATWVARAYAAYRVEDGRFRLGNKIINQQPQERPRYLSTDQPDTRSRSPGITINPDPDPNPNTLTLTP